MAQSAGNDDLPPGVTADGVTNATAPVEAHRTTLAETGYTILTRSSSDAPAFGFETEGQSVVTVGPGHTPFRSTATARLSPGNDGTIPGMDGQGPAVNATGPPNATGSPNATGPGNGSGPPDTTGQTNETDGPNATAGPLEEDATISVDQWGDGTVVLSRIRMDNRTRYLKQYVNESSGPFGISPVTVSPDRLAADHIGANVSAAAEGS